jgi:hypothetical protein
LSLILFNLYSEYPTKEAVEVFGDFDIRGKVICTGKRAMNLCYWLKNKRYYRAWLRLTEVGRSYGM